jgi:radical SAM protein with 4Fe4S-binding SPASM domain
MSEVRPVRMLGAEDDPNRPRPIFVVWEITMKCDQPCQHCGSRAGPARVKELTTEESFAIAESLQRLGTREVTLIGGEAYLRPDVYDIVRKLVSLDIRVTMQTGGRAFTAERARLFKEAGLSGLGVSIDGPALIHDKLRGNVGSYAAAMQALENARAVGLTLSVNSQVNRLNWMMLREFAQTIREKGVEAWQVQLTGPMGRAADQPDWIIEPYRVVDVIEMLAEIQKEAAEEYFAGKAPFFNIFPNNNIGYFGPYEQILRSRVGNPETHFQSCMAGIFNMGIESDGTVKGCPTLPTAPYNGGNVRTMKLEEIWESSDALRFTRDRTTDELWGFCKTCYYADICRGGCSWMVHTTLGKRGNNPFCYHRVKELKKRGIRERLQHKAKASNQPYDFGLFEIVEEPWVNDDEPPNKGNKIRLPIVG